MNKKDILKSSVVDLLYKIEDKNENRGPGPGMMDYAKAFEESLDNTLKTGDISFLTIFGRATIKKPEINMSVGEHAHKLLTEALNNHYKKHKNEQENQKAKGKNRHIKK